MYTICGSISSVKTRLLSFNFVQVCEFKGFCLKNTFLTSSNFKFVNSFQIKGLNYQTDKISRNKANAPWYINVTQPPDQQLCVYILKNSLLPAHMIHMPTNSDSDTVYMYVTVPK